LLRLNVLTSMKNRGGLVILGIVLILGLIALGYLIKRKVDSNSDQDNRQPSVMSFEDCRLAGYAVMESFPRQCRTPDGRNFIEGTTSDNSETNSGWAIQNDSTTGLTFEYPRALPVKYITPFDWPPKLQITNQMFDCTEAGSETDRTGKTEKMTVEGRPYCLTRITEGAAGSVYTQYSYAFPRGNTTAILTFSLRAHQCGNYPEAERVVCENERKSFVLDKTIDQVARSLR
jgi:hypothetical protein